MLKVSDLVRVISWEHWWRRQASPTAKYLSRTHRLTGASPVCSSMKSCLSSSGMSSSESESWLNVRPSPLLNCKKQTRINMVYRRLQNWYMVTSVSCPKLWNETNVNNVIWGLTFALLSLYEDEIASYIPIHWHRIKPLILEQCLSCL